MTLIDVKIPMVRIQVLKQYGKVRVAGERIENWISDRYNFMYTYSISDVASYRIPHATLISNSFYLQR